MADLSLVAAHPESATSSTPRGSQRARLVEGMIQAVAEKGYAAATVADAVRAARVSRGTFYAQFASKEECFLEAYKYGIDVIVERIRTAIRAEQRRLGRPPAHRPARLPGDARRRAALRAHPPLRGPHGRPARGRRARRGPRAFADRYVVVPRAAPANERPELRMPSDDALFILSAGVDQLVCARVRAGELDHLPDLTDELTLTAVAFLEGVAKCHLPLRGI